MPLPVVHTARNNSGHIRLACQADIRRPSRIAQSGAGEVEGQRFVTSEFKGGLPIRTGDDG